MPTPNTQPVDSLWLKWGTWKSFDCKSPAAKEALAAYMAAGEQSGSAMSQHETPEQKVALCALIDALDCETVGNDWTGEQMTKVEAKRYVMEYRS